MARGRKPGEQHYWTLVADPKEYRILEAISSLDEDWWTSGQSDIRPGDQVAIWKAKGGGTQRGIVALGKVTSGPLYRADKDNPYHLNLGRASGIIPRVAIRYVLLPEPLWETGPHAPLISSLSAARAYGGTVFRLSAEQWSQIEAIARDILNLDAEAPDAPFSLEESKRYKVHRRIERNPSASAAVKAHHGCNCQACGFEFQNMYGGLGVSFIEVHHLRPLATLTEDEAVLYGPDQFAVLCSNCHRMIHRTDDPSDLAAFRKLIRLEPSR